MFKRFVTTVVAATLGTLCLVAPSEASVPGPRGAFLVLSEHEVLSPGESRTYSVMMYAGQWGRMSVVGDSLAKPGSFMNYVSLDLFIYDANGRLVDSSTSTPGRSSASCMWAVRVTGVYRVRVVNRAVGSVDCYITSN